MDSREVARAAIEISMTPSREDESVLQKKHLAKGIKSSAVDYGGEFLSSPQKVVERAIVAARREQVIGSSHQEEGAVAGAAREALAQVMPKALGLNVGGKVGIARGGDHIAVAVFFAIGLLHLNEVAVGLGHRVI
ncbi:MAG TPA: HutP family protein [Bacillota bacterium]|nr:hut operon positive regulator HutP [Bacillota bacterium]HOA34847.1 HutP family protein [Bacillota bacterium]HOJ84901.1 HutP family protein [Bacillota bacterium]HOL14556.1 HutP family protein [Bacillota bacterium]HPZ10813.1 HutP family protein [Bacillota bacterium]